MSSALSAADVMALTGGGNESGGMWDNPFVYLVWIWAFSMFSGNGIGGMGGGASVVESQINNDFLYTNLRSDMNSSFAQLDSAVRGVQNGLCDGFYNSTVTNLQGFNEVGKGMSQGFYGLDKSIYTTTNGIESLINQARFDAKECCCETNRNIDNIRYENAKNTCDIINAGHADTQRIIDTISTNTIQELRDRLEEKDRQQLRADFQLSQLAQTSNIIGAVRPFPQPAYITCSPYQSSVPYVA